VFRLRGLGRRGAAARFSRGRYPRGVKMDRLDGHHELKQWDGHSGRPPVFTRAQRNGRCGVNTAPNDPNLLRRGTIRVVPDNMAG
jgi:hypothetical protein